MSDSLTVHRLAMALPEAVEQDHHGVPSYRIRGKIFATVPDAEHVHVMLSEDAIREAVAADPVACEEQHWGQRLSAVRVRLARIEPEALAALLSAAWRRRAPAALMRAFDELAAS